MDKYNIESIARARGPIPMTSVSSWVDVPCWLLLLSSLLTNNLPEVASDG